MKTITVCVTLGAIAILLGAPLTASAVKLSSYPDQFDARIDVYYDWDGSKADPGMYEQGSMFVTILARMHRWGPSDPSGAIYRADTVTADVQYTNRRYDWRPYAEGCYSATGRPGLQEVLSLGTAPVGDLAVVFYSAADGIDALCSAAESFVQEPVCHNQATGCNGSSGIHDTVFVIQGSVSFSNISQCLDEECCINGNSEPIRLDFKVYEILVPAMLNGTLAPEWRWDTEDQYGLQTWDQSFGYAILCDVAYHPPMTANLQNALASYKVAFGFANLVRNAKPGRFLGLAWPTGAPPAGSAGSVDLTVDQDLRFKGKLTACGVTYPITGQFDANGHWNAQSPLPIALQLDSISEQITGTVAGASCAATVTANRQVYDKKGNPAPWAEYYTMAVLPAGASGPQGFGWATAKVDAGGGVLLNGVLADGARVTQKTTVSQDGQIPVYVPLYGNKGALSGWITITDQTSGSCTGNLDWVKLAKASDKYYPGGFAVPVSVQGGKYIPPATGVRVLNLANTTGNAQVSLSGGDLASAQQNTVTVSAANTVTVVSGASQKLTVKITPKTGLFSGSFVHPATGKPAKFSGVIVQTSNEGRGYFLGTTKAGSVLIQSAP